LTTHFRRSFSKDSSGKLIRNFYCLECGAGPFNQEDVNKNVLIEKGCGSQTIYFCRKCCKLKFLGKDLPEIGEDLLEREKYVMSGKVLEDMKSGKKIEEEKPIEIQPIEKLEKPKEIFVTEVIVDNIIEEPVLITPEHSEEINFKNLSAMALINLVENKTGQRITKSPKDKKNIIKHAKRILEEKGFKVNV
jgi:hypothetical protein